MKTMIFSVSFFAVTCASAATTGMTWNKNLVAKLKNQTAFAAFCQKPKGIFAKEACTDSAEDPGFKNFKFKNIELVSPTNIRVGDGPRSIEISFGQKYGQFVLNGRTVDFASMTSEEIAEKISTALPKVGATSFLMNSAYAANDSFVYLKRAVHAMLANKSDEDVCDNAQKVVDICEGTEPMTGAGSLLKAQNTYKELLAKSPKASETELDQALAKVEEEAEKANTFLDLSAGLFNNAYGRAPDTCEVTVKEKKTKAQPVLLNCKETFAKKQEENNKEVAALSIQRNNPEMKELVAGLAAKLDDINFSMTKHDRYEFKSKSLPSQNTKDLGGQNQ